MVPLVVVAGVEACQAAGESVSLPQEVGGKEEVGMPLYMSQFAYTPEAWAALTRDPQDRNVAVRGLMESMGGRLVAFYHSFGEYDGVLIFESPDDTAGPPAFWRLFRPDTSRRSRRQRCLASRTPWRRCAGRVR